MAPAQARLLVVLLALLAACTGGRYTVQREGASATDYSPTDRVRVMLAKPGVADETAARTVSAKIVAALMTRHGDVALVPTSNDAEALEAARAAQATFLISPTILEWHDGHAPPFTADRIKVRMDLRDPNTGEVINTATFENVSSIYAGFDTQPDALLDATFDRAVAALITGGSTGRGVAQQ